MTKTISPPLKETLTKKQAEFYKVLVKLIKKNDGACPTYRQLADACGYKSHGFAMRLMYGLEERGWIKRHETRRLSITIL